MKSKGKVFPLQAINAYGNGNLGQFILKLDT
jgi:hypothetical protein